VASRAILAFSCLGENDSSASPREIDVSVAQPAITGAPVPVGLSSAEADRRRLEFGPNEVVEERAHPMVQIARHFWAPVP